jgi:hypothetical protein
VARVPPRIHADPIAGSTTSVSSAPAPERRHGGEVLTEAGADVVLLEAGPM